MREQIETYLQEQFGVSAEYLFAKFPEYAVYRHPGGKWFALFMELEKVKIGWQAEETVNVVNVKVPPELGDTLRLKEGIYPAYHMNKKHWLSIALDGQVPLDEIKQLLAQSYQQVKS